MHMNWPELLQSTTAGYSVFEERFLEVRKCIIVLARMSTTIIVLAFLGMLLLVLLAYVSLCGSVYDLSRKTLA